MGERHAGEIVADIGQAAADEMADWNRQLREERDALAIALGAALCPRSDGEWHVSECASHPACPVCDPLARYKKRHK